MRQIFVNLPVKDLERSKRFFSSLGFGFDARFDDKAACLVIEKDSIYAMLITEPFFKTFTPRAVADAKSTSEVLLALSCSSEREVNDLAAKATAAGGKAIREQDHGFMYYRSFEDPDGHIWELLHMRREPQ